MPAFTPTTSYGTDVFYGDASGTVTTSIDNVVNVSVPTDTFATIDASHLGSARRLYIPGIPDGGELQITCHYKAANFSALNALKGVAKWYKIGFPDTSGDILFSGIATSLEVSFGDVDTIPEMTLTVKVNSASTITVGT